MLDVKMCGPSNDKNAPMTATSWAVKCIPAADAHEAATVPAESAESPGCLLISCKTAMTLYSVRWFEKLQFKSLSTSLMRRAVLSCSVLLKI